MVQAPAAAIWDTLTDLKRYPKFIGGLSSVEQYSTRKTLTGGQLFCARYTLSVGPLYKVKYFVEHRHEPLQKSMVGTLDYFHPHPHPHPQPQPQPQPNPEQVWQLDYSRSSDVYDSVGYWHVEPLDDQRCIVYYTQDPPSPPGS